jgi:hypothetical protein
MTDPKTPQEISDYKNRWMQDIDHSVRLHSDLDVKGKDWCRRNLPRWKWSMKKYTNVYEHTFFFEEEHAAAEFSKQWPEYTNQ